MTFTPEEIRKLRGAMSQTKFAELIGTSYQTVSDWERGVKRPSTMARKSLERIASER